MDVFQFDGSFLSLVLELPEEAVEGLKLTHLIRLDAIVEMEKPLEIFARLNIKHGPNVEQVVRELPLNEEEVKVEFDLAYTKLNEKRVERIWVDLIFEGPEMNQVILRDVTFSRRPRAEL
jgi:predicted transposase YdaD